MTKIDAQDDERARVGPDSGVVMFVRPSTAVVSFDKVELRQILNLYGRKVAEGEWRDYALDFLREVAVFSVFRRSSEMPLYRIIKNPALARRQGAYSITTTGGLVLKRGHELPRVLLALDKPLRIVRQDVPANKNPRQ